MFSDRATTPNDLLRQLLSRMAQADRTAFDSFYREMEKPVFRFIRSKLNDPFTCADILHDVFLDVWRAAPGFDGRSSVKTWVFSIAYRKVVDFMRKNSRFIDEDSIPEQEDEGPAAVECIWKAEEADMLRACLETLKPDHRLAVEMTFYNDMSYKEIAEVTNVPEGTVKTRVFHAKSLLLRCLQQRMRAKVRE